MRYIRSRAPLRIGLAGGGTDVDPYASEKGGIVFNTTIAKYAYCTITPNDSKKMSIESTNYGRHEVSLDGGPLPLDGNMDLVKAVTNHFEIKQGFNMLLQSDAPPGSGLGGSSTVIVAAIAAVAEWVGKKMTSHEMAQLAYELEREDIGLKGGKQDQYAAVFGGFNLMKFRSDGVDVNSVKVKENTLKELQYRSVLCYTGNVRDSANIIESQVKSYQKGDNERALDETKKIAAEMAAALEKDDIEETGRLLDVGWEYKKQFTDKITNPRIDELYNAAKSAGAIGGKVSGAGGGGFMFFVCDYDKKFVVSEKLMKHGAIVTDFTFEPKGVTVWRNGYE